METVFITKLKGFVTDNSMPILNSLVFRVSANKSVWLAGRSNASPIIVDVIGGQLRTGSSSEDILVTPYSISSTGAMYYITPEQEDCQVIIKPKNNITQVVNVPLTVDGTYGALKSIGTTGRNDSFATFDLSNALDIPNLEVLRCEDNANISGDVKHLGSCAKISYIGLRDCTNIQGSIESIVALLIDGGRTAAATKSKGITFVSRANITFGTKSLASGGGLASGYVLWSSAANEGEYTITYYNDSDVALESVTITPTEYLD